MHWSIPLSQKREHHTGVNANLLGNIKACLLDIAAKPFCGSSKSSTVTRTQEKKRGQLRSYDKFSAVLLPPAVENVINLSPTALLRVESHVRRAKVEKQILHFTSTLFHFCRTPTGPT